MHLVFLALALAAAPAEGAAGELPPAFYDCDISSGQAIRCGATYQGKAVVVVNKLVQECSILDGQLTGCEGPFQGRAVVRHEGIYQSCDVADGQVARCTSWHEGKAAVWKGKGPPQLAKVAKKAEEKKPAKPRPKPPKKKPNGM